MTAATEFVHRFQAMASDVTIRVALDDPDPRAAVHAAHQVFAELEQSCTRFDPASPLMRANAAGSEWSPVPASCFEALVEAHAAYQDTGGLFDPRVLSALRGLGYAASFGDRTESDSPLPHELNPITSEWKPEFRAEPPAVRIGPHPVDLGGIGKGLAIRRAAALMRAEAIDFLIEAGGDCYLAGRTADGAPWSVGVEDPFGSATPRAVLALSDTACATTSTRLRSWSARGEQVHHIIDPGTGTSSAGGLAAVTVVHPDPARAEVFTKVLFLAGRTDIDRRSAELGLAALWIDEDGGLSWSPTMANLIVWRSA